MSKRRAASQDGVTRWRSSATAAWPRSPAIFFSGLVALYAAFGLCLANAPMQDLPDHLTRAHIIADLIFDHGAQFGEAFALKSSFSPYLAGDMVLASLDRCIGTAWASRIWIASLMALLPLSVWFVLRRQGTSAVAACTAGALALYVATDHFFILGFGNYLFGVACAFFTYGWLYTAARTARATDYACFVALLLLSYTVHLTALIFIGVIAAASVTLWVLRKEIPAGRAAVLMLPVVVLVLFQLLAAPAMDLYGEAVHAASVAGGPDGHAAHWGAEALSKIMGFGFPAQRFEATADLLLFALLVATALLPVLSGWPRALRAGAEPLLIGCALALLYVVTPTVVGGVWYSDVRPLQYALLFLIVAGVRCADLDPGIRRVQWASALIVAMTNLGYAAAYMLPENAALERYQAVVASIPQGATVMPIDTRPVDYYRPFLHAGAYATLNARALTPYILAGDIVRNMPYFQYRKGRPYAPRESWYSFHMKVAWSQVVSRYQYLLVTVPWTAEMIPVAYSVTARNDVAALLRLCASGDCGRPAPSAAIRGSGGQNHDESSEHQEDSGCECD